MEPTLEAVTAWLDASVNRERSGDFRGLHLEPLARVLPFLPRPPAPVTVAGTKGKGSTLRLIEVGLGVLGRPTVAFTSPHVLSIAERWRWDGRPALAQDLADAIAVVAAAESAAAQVLSWFERSLAMAVVLAARRPQAVFLAEVGIGGRCDAVNALDARIAVVTHLSHDHRDVLGPTLDDIAYQKLGIARSDAPLVIARQSPAAEAAVARRLAAGDGSSWVLRPAPWTGTLGLRGQHQRENAATAAAVLELLVPGYDRGVVAQAWAVADLPARCQVVAQGGRTLLIDGAHNGPSVAATLAVAQEVLRGGFTVVLGLARDKEAEEVLAAIPTGTPVVRCGYDSPRARGAEDWPDDRTPWHASITSALGLPGDLCITGSFYLAAEALAAVGQNP